jgi:hypothetical protein
MAKNRNLRNLDLPISAIYRLAAPSTPEPIRQEILAEAQDGRLTLAEVEARIAAAKAETTEAQRQCLRVDECMVRRSPMLSQF